MRDEGRGARGEGIAVRDAPAWTCDRVRFRYPGTSDDVLSDIDIAVPAGACTAVIGPNGSGKSTLLRLLLGLAAPNVGEVRFAGTRAGDWDREAMAREVGVVPQGEEGAFPLTVREMVAMGRYPYLGRWRAEGRDDRRAIAAAMRRCDVSGLSRRPVSTLSGGERQRARLARALAQEPGTLALDEPTVALDIRHEMAIFELLRTLADAGTTVLLVTHNLNLAARYADRLVLLDGGRVAAAGTAGEVLTRERIEDVYGWPVRVVPFDDARGTVPQIVPLGGEACQEMSSGHPIARSAALSNTNDDNDP